MQKSPTQDSRVQKALQVPGTPLQGGGFAGKRQLTPWVREDQPLRAAAALLPQDGPRRRLEEIGQEGLGQSPQPGAAGGWHRGQSHLLVLQLPSLQIEGIMLAMLPSSQGGR